MKKLMILVMSFALVFPLMSETETVDGYTWTYSVKNGTAEIGKGSASAAISPNPRGAVTIPSTLGGMTVTSIGSYAFYKCDGITSITIPDSVTSIGSYVFRDCDGLISITIPNSVTTIGSYAFYNCNGLTSITIPDSVTSINNNSFYNCGGLMSITVGSGNNNYTSVNGLLLSKDGKKLIRGVNGDVTIPDGVTSIDSFAFYGCIGLKSVTIPKSVTTIASGVFRGCSGLMSITVESGNKTFTSVNGLLLYKKLGLIRSINGDVTIPDSVKSIWDYAFSGCSRLTSMTIPDGVTSIGSFAFEDCNSLASVTIPSGVTSIEKYAFYGCSSLTSVTIPDGVTSIGTYAFYKCSSLTNMTIPNKVTSIGNYAFYYCSGLTSVMIPESVRSIGEDAFSYCRSLTNVVIPDSVTSIGKYAFSYCSDLTSVTIGNGVTSIGNYAFVSCSRLTSITFNGNAPNIGTNAFKGLGRDCVAYVRRTAEAFPNEGEMWNGMTIAYSPPVFTIENGVLTNVDINGAPKVEIPYGVTSIGSCVFSNCSSLTNVTIPNSVTNIGDKAFFGCSELTSITFEGNAPNIGVNVFSGVSEDCVAYVRKAGVGFPAVGEKWNSMTIAYSPPVFTIEKGVLKGVDLNGATRVKIPDGVTSIGDYVFEYCSNLTSVTIPSSVTKIGYGAFYGCSGLTNVMMSGSVMSINVGAFNGCTGLIDDNGFLIVQGFLCEYVGVGGNLTIPDGVTSIGASVFEYCDLASVTMPDSVTSIGNYAFFRCSNLTSVTVPDSVTNIGNYAFCNCSGLTNVTLGASVTSIGWYAFQDCSGLTSVTIPASVRELHDAGKVFSGCSGIRSFVVDENNPYFSSANGMVLSKDGTTLIIGLGGNATIPAGVMEIGSEAFLNCNSLTSITIPDGVECIGYSAFQGCNGLTSVTIPDSVVEIRQHAFHRCYNLSSVHIGDGVEYIGELRPGSGGGGYTSYIHSQAFADCRSLQSFTVGSGNSVYKAENGMLLSKDGKKLVAGVNGNVIIPDTVTCIGYSAFGGCSGLTSVTVPCSLTAIESRAFYGCSALTSVVFNGNALTVDDESFYSGANERVAYVKPTADGFPSEGEKWKGFTIAYIPDSVAVGEKGTIAQNGDGEYVVTATDGMVLTTNDFTFSALVNGRREDTSRGYAVMIAGDGKSAVVQLKRPELALGAADATGQVDSDPSGLLANVAEHEITAKPMPNAGCEIGALAVDAVPGLQYQAAWGESLETMTQGAKVQATCGRLYLGVIKQTGSSGFYKVSVSEK